MCAESGGRLECHLALRALEALGSVADVERLNIFYTSLLLLKGDRLPAVLQTELQAQLAGWQAPSASTPFALEPALTLLGHALLGHAGVVRKALDILPPALQVLLLPSDLPALVEPARAIERGMSAAAVPAGDIWFNKLLPPAGLERSAEYAQLIDLQAKCIRCVLFNEMHGLQLVQQMPTCSYASQHYVSSVHFTHSN